MGVCRRLLGRKRISKLDKCTRFILMNFLKNSVGIDEDALIIELRQVSRLQQEQISELARLSILYLRNPALKPADFLAKLDASIDQSHARSFLLMLKLANNSGTTSEALLADMTELGFTEEIAALVTGSWSGVAALNTIQNEASKDLLDL